MNEKLDLRVIELTEELGALKSSVNALIFQLKELNDYFKKAEREKEWATRR